MEKKVTENKKSFFLKSYKANLALIVIGWLLATVFQGSSDPITVIIAGTASLGAFFGVAGLVFKIFSKPKKN